MSHVWLFGIFFITAIALTDARNRQRRIIEYENEICEPRKRYLDFDGCSECVCLVHGYGSVCKRVECRRIYRRPVEARECEPYSEFRTACHRCKCSAAGLPIDCVEMRPRCMEKILADLDAEIFNLQPKIEPMSKYLYH